MSIKPVDFQVMVPKIPEVSKIHSSEAQKNHAIYQQAAASVQNKAENNLKQVYSQDRANEAKIKEKQEKDRGGKKEQGKKEKDKSRKAGYPVQTKKESVIDIKI